MQENRNRKMEKMKSSGYSSGPKLVKDCQEKTSFKSMMELPFITVEESERVVPVTKSPLPQGQH